MKLNIMGLNNDLKDKETIKKKKEIVKNELSKNRSNLIQSLIMCYGTLIIMVIVPFTVSDPIGIIGLLICGYHFTGALRSTITIHKLEKLEFELMFHTHTDL